MKLNFQQYQDKVKACWIGKNIGGTMGTPYEGKREVLDIKGFATAPNVVLPNDDLDLQLVWLYALERLGPQAINASTLGEFWLSYIPPHWNEYGTGKANMRRGIVPPMSGDYENDWQHSNGAWIRTEIWACTAPGLPEVACKNAMEDAKVDHGAGEGTFAAAFVAAMQASAFVVSDLRDCIDIALEAIPATSRTAQSIRLVLEYYQSGKTWLEARNAVLEQNKDIGDGWFEAPSNVAYTVLGLVYGEGDFKKSMITAINCGDDTDCTGATVGSTLGILYGTDGIPTDWMTHIGDEIVTISIARGGDARPLPNTCTELTERVVDVTPTVLYAYNQTLSKSKRAVSGVFFDDSTEIPENITDLLKRSMITKVQPKVQALKPYSAHFEQAFLQADVTLSHAPEITPMGEIGVHIDFTNNRVYENQQHTLALRWILPEGFTAEGRKNLLLQRYDPHAKGNVSADFVIRAGEQVSAENRIILEVTVHGRHTAMYISFPLLG